jgi:hypothetical protein
MTADRHLRRSAAFLFTAILSAALVPGLALASPQEGRLQIEYFFLVDVSGSMAGQAGHADIFPAVKVAIGDFIRELAPGTTVHVAPFDAVIHEIRTFPLTTAADAAKPVDYVAGLQATGTKTGVFDAIARAVAFVSDRRAGRPELVTVFFVYTDGDDNVSTRWTLPAILDQFELARGTHDWLFYAELGLPHDAAKQAAFERVGHVRYVREAHGTVHPIAQVHPTLAVLDFGNLKTVATSSRRQVFEILGLAATRDRPTLSLEARFDAVSSQGTLVRLQPDTAAVQSDMDLRLSLVNPESLAQGEYRGTVHLVSSDPLVLVVPSSFDAKFRFEPPRTVRVTPEGAASSPVDFGRSVRGQSQAPLERVFRIEFSPTAERAGAVLRVRVDEATTNPQALPVTHGVAVNGQPGSAAVLAPNAASLRVSFGGDLEAGTYSGTLTFEGDDLVITGLTPSPPADGRLVLPWIFTVDRAPLPLWVWAAMALALAGAAGAFAWARLKPPVFSDLVLSVVEPLRGDISLAGRPQVVLGACGTECTQWPGTVRIRAVRRAGTVLACLEPQQGEVLIKRPGSRQDVPVVGEEEIYDGDVLRIGPYRLRVSSFSLTRG